MDSHDLPHAEVFAARILIVLCVTSAIQHVFGMGVQRISCGCVACDAMGTAKVHCFGYDYLSDF